MFTLAALAAFGAPSAATAQVQAGGIEPAPEPYQLLDRVGGSWVNLATFPVRPMAFDSAGNLWVANHNDSTVERFSGTETTPSKVYGVPWAPVAIAVWSHAGQDELLVVCRGTWAVVGLDPTTGAPKRLLQLRPGGTLPGNLDARIGRMAEPGDILVDQVNGRAFVSCSGADSVVQIDLVTNQIVRVFQEEADPAFRLKSPLFLSWDQDHANVLCAPLHSGNNSYSLGPLQNSSLVRNGEDVTPHVLPDEDLFRIHPYVDAANPGSVDVLLQGVGTILFAHGINPSTDDFWQLNTEALNKDPNKQSEPAVRGHFVQNRVSIVQNSGSTWGTTVNAIGLDPGGLSGAITTANTVGQPYALTFLQDGYALITGSLTDNVIVLDSSGGYNMEWDLRPAGDSVRAIPRGIIEHPTLANVVYVFCWGRNEVRSYLVRTTTHKATLRSVLSLRHDSTPPAVAAGRRVFFDASHSEQQNLSCASCHIEGGNDFLLWNLSNSPLEQKGPMFTQTLVGLERLAPFHWRGERQLIDFKPAFVGLLGASAEPSSTDFGFLEDYFFSLVNPANPNQNRRRMLDHQIHHDSPNFTGDFHVSNANGDAVDGQAAFQVDANILLAGHACVDCHGFPTGTNSEINLEGNQQRPRRVSMKPAPFHEGWRKAQTRVQTSFGTVPFLGAGFSHLGLFADAFRFMSTVVDNSVPGTQKANDLADFLDQWDQGLAPAVHYAYLLDAASLSTATAELSTYLHGEAYKENCDIAVFGMANNGAGLVARRWAWDRLAVAYVCEDPAFPNRSLADFLTRAAAPYLETNVFVGLPRGMAERFAIDYDLDGVKNRAEPAFPPGAEYLVTVPASTDTTPPGYASGGTPQILWTSTKVARLVFTTNEPTTAIVLYAESNQPARKAESPLLSRHHSILLTGLRPSTDAIDGTAVTEYSAEAVHYLATLELRDARNNLFSDPSTYPFDSQTFIVPFELEQPNPPPISSDQSRDQRSHVVREICIRSTNCDELTPLVNGWHADIDLTIAFKRGNWNNASGFGPAPAPNRAVVGRVVIQRASGEVETAFAAGLSVTPTGGSAALVDDVHTFKDGPNGGTTLALEGIEGPQKYLAGLLRSGSDGKTTISFDVGRVSSNGPLDDLLPGDRVLFNVEAVLEVVTGVGTIRTLNGTTTYTVPWRSGFLQWSFPDTKDSGATARSAPLQ